MNLHIALDQETDGRWIAEVPAVPGVMTYGMTPTEAAAKARSLASDVLTERLQLGEPGAAACTD